VVAAYIGGVPFDVIFDDEFAAEFRRLTRDVQIAIGKYIDALRREGTD
jgi:hypothetical protein